MEFVTDILQAKFQVCTYFFLQILLQLETLTKKMLTDRQTDKGTSLIHRPELLEQSSQKVMSNTRQH